MMHIRPLKDVGGGKRYEEWPSSIPASMCNIRSLASPHLTSPRLRLHLTDLRFFSSNFNQSSLFIQSRARSSPLHLRISSPRTASQVKAGRALQDTRKVGPLRPRDPKIFFHGQAGRFINESP